MAGYRKPQAPKLPPRPLLPASSPVSHLSYYHPHLKDLTDVREIMAPFVLQDGAYLLRNSSKKPDTYTVSVMHDKSIKHFYIFTRDNTFYLQDKFFTSIDKLINHYRHEDVPNMEGIKHIRLMHPIANTSASVTNGNHALGGSTGQDIESGDKSLNRKSKKKFFSLRGGEKKDAGSYCSLRKEDDMSTLSKGHTGSGATGYVGYNPTPARRSSDISQRPQAPLPVRYGDDNSASKNLYYSSVKETEVNQVPALINMLKVDERAKCDCGLFFDEAELPRGWTMHISHDPGTEGRVFFMGADRQTAWNLPLEVACELSLEQQDRIRDLLDKYEAEHMRAATQRQLSNANPAAQRRASEDYPRGQRQSIEDYPRGQRQSSEDYPRGQRRPSEDYARGQRRPSQDYPTVQGSDLARQFGSSPQSSSFSRTSVSNDDTGMNQEVTTPSPSMAQSNGETNHNKGETDKDEVFM